jgi:hypothetical protein
MVLNLRMLSFITGVLLGSVLGSACLSERTPAVT